MSELIKVVLGEEDLPRQWYNLAADLPNLAMDADRMAQAIGNLLSNAVKYTPSGGRVLVSYRETDRQGICEVTDTGPGIPDEVKTKLFTDQAVSTKAMGTGLGTRIVKDVVDAHGGTLELESEVGVGTTIRCRMPLQRESDGPNGKS